MIPNSNTTTLHGKTATGSEENITSVVISNGKVPNSGSTAQLLAENVRVLTTPLWRTNETQQRIAIGWPRTSIVATAIGMDTPSSISVP